MSNIYNSKIRHINTHRLLISVATFLWCFSICLIVVGLVLSFVLLYCRLGIRSSCFCQGFVIDADASSAIFPFLLPKLHHHSVHPHITLWRQLNADAKPKLVVLLGPSQPLPLKGHLRTKPEHGCEQLFVILVLPLGSCIHVLGQPWEVPLHTAARYTLEIMSRTFPIFMCKNQPVPLISHVCRGSVQLTIQCPSPGNSLPTTRR